MDKSVRTIKMSEIHMHDGSNTMYDKRVSLPIPTHVDFVDLPASSDRDSAPKAY